MTYALAADAGGFSISGSASYYPYRMAADHGAFALAGSSVALRLNYTTNLGIALNIKLDRLKRDVSIVDERGFPSFQFQRLWQAMVETVEEAIKALASATAAIQTAYDAAAAASEAASDANNAAAAVTASNALKDSYTDPVNVLTATNDGAVTIAAHIRRYTDGTSVAVNGGTVSGYAAGDVVRPYYDDPTRSGGAVTYMSTTDETVAVQTGDRHTVGAVRIPAPTSPPSSGTGTRPPGSPSGADIP